MSNIIDSIKLSGVTYTIQGSGGGGNPTVELTQAQYDVLVTAGTVQADTYYIITDAQGGDLSNYMTSAQTMSAITEATSGKVDSNVYTAYTASTDTAIQGKQDTLVSGTNIKTINNQSLLGSGNIDIQGGGGGGKTISAGRGISITTGETADTVSFDLPISAGSQSNSVVVNYNGNRASGWMSFAQGRYTLANNQTESAFGNYNISSNSSNSFGNSGNTLFTVGNGEGSTTTHNSFEIRQNGDIYIADTNDTSTINYWEKPMIKLQDALGGGSITIDPSLDSGSTNAVANSAITTAFNSCYGNGTYWDMVGLPRKNIPLRMKKYGTNSYDDVTLNLGSNLVYGSEGFQTLSVSGVVETSAITTAITSSSTDAQVPSAKAVYVIVGDIETLLSQI